MRVIFVAPYLPLPGSGGRTRLTNLMSRHAERHDVRLVALAPPDQDPSEVVYPGTILSYPTPIRSPGRRGTIEYFRERFTEALPNYALHARVPGFADALQEECRTFKPDLVQFEHPETGQYFQACGITPALVMDFHDVASRWIGRQTRATKNARAKAFLALELAKTRRYERGIARNADGNIVCSPLEAEELFRISGVRPLVAYNGVDASMFAPMPEIAEEANRLLYVGPMKYGANTDAMRWFSREIFPLVRRAVPEAALDIAGIPSDESFGPGIRQLGKVADVRIELARAAVSIVPIRAASGTRYKILEALAMERAVVSTTLGAEGLDVTHGEHLLIADTPKAFADAVLEALQDPPFRARLGKSGRAYVAKRFAWEPIVDSIEQEWDRALARKRA